MASRREIATFLAIFIESGLVARKPGSGRLSKAAAEVRKIIEEAMRTDDETTEKAYLETSVSLSAPFYLISTYARNREMAVLHSRGKNGHTLATRGDVTTQRKYKTERTVEQNGPLNAVF